MPLFEITPSGLLERPPTEFAALGIYERSDIQQLLRNQIGALGEDLLVISEEFGNWEDANRRIDLLALDKKGRLVVIELKRTQGGGHMELQAVRYAAMVSAMRYVDIVEAHQAYLEKDGLDQDADRAIRAFLAVDDEEDPEILSDVRIVLGSADFSRELTTAVLWLNGFEGIDIRCVRLIPYEIEGKTLLHVEQVIPLPEAEEYQVRLRRKEQEKERVRIDNRDFSRFRVVIDGKELPDENKRNSIRVMVKSLVAQGVSPGEILELLPARKMWRIPGTFDQKDDLLHAFRAVFPEVTPERWYIDEAIRSRGDTYVLSKMWGPQTEQVLQDLASGFPESKVAFRKAET